MARVVTLSLLALAGVATCDNVTRSVSVSRHYSSYPAHRVFPCPAHYSEPAHSAYSGRTVNNLRPQDIDIVASVGDSVTAGQGNIWYGSLLAIDCSTAEESRRKRGECNF